MNIISLLLNHRLVDDAGYDKTSIKMQIAEELKRLYEIERKYLDMKK